MRARVRGGAQSRARASPLDTGLPCLCERLYIARCLSFAFLFECAAASTRCFELLLDRCCSLVESMPSMARAKSFNALHFVQSCCCLACAVFSSASKPSWATLPLDALRQICLVGALQGVPDKAQCICGAGCPNVFRYTASQARGYGTSYAYNFSLLYFRSSTH